MVKKIRDSEIRSLQYLKNGIESFQPFLTQDVFKLTTQPVRKAKTPQQGQEVTMKEKK